MYSRNIDVISLITQRDSNTNTPNQLLPYLEV